MGLKVISQHWTRGSLLMSLSSLFPLTRRLHLKTASCPLGCAAWWEEEEQMRFYYNDCNFLQELGAAGALTGSPNTVLAASLYTCTRPTAVCRSLHQLPHWSSPAVKVIIQYTNFSWNRCIKYQISLLINFFLLHLQNAPLWKKRKRNMSSLTILIIKKKKTRCTVFNCNKKSTTKTTTRC